MLKLPFWQVSESIPWIDIRVNHQGERYLQV